MRKYLLALIAIVALFAGCTKPEEPAPVVSDDATMTGEPAPMDAAPAVDPGSAATEGAPAGEPGSTATEGAPAGEPGSTATEGAPAAAPTSEGAAPADSPGMNETDGPPISKTP